MRNYELQGSCNNKEITTRRVNRDKTCTVKVAGSELPFMVSLSQFRISDS